LTEKEGEVLIHLFRGLRFDHNRNAAFMQHVLKLPTIQPGNLRRAPCCFPSAIAT
jgi:hypothetical protein